MFFIVVAAVVTVTVAVVIVVVLLAEYKNEQNSKQLALFSTLNICIS